MTLDSKYGIIHPDLKSTTPLRGADDGKGKRFVSLAVFYLAERIDTMIEDCMLHREPGTFSLRAYIDRLRELRKKLDAARTPEEIDKIKAELDECHRDFFIRKAGVKE